MVRLVARDGEKPEVAPLFRSPMHAVGSFAVALLSVAVVFLLAASRLATTAPMQALPKNLLSAVAMLMPQGWSFFTKSPRLDVMRVWIGADDGSWRLRPPTPSGSAGSVFGIDRAARVEGLQLAFIQAPLSIEPERWSACTVGKVQQCLSDSEPIQVLNPSRVPVFCGKIGIELRPAKPFEWRDLPNDAARNKVATFDVRCALGARS